MYQKRKKYTFSIAIIFNIISKYQRIKRKGEKGVWLTHLPYTYTCDNLCYDLEELLDLEEKQELDVNSWENSHDLLAILS